MQFLSQLLLTLTLAASLAVSAPLTPGGPEPQSAAPDAALKTRQQAGEMCLTGGPPIFFCRRTEYPVCCGSMGPMATYCCKGAVPGPASCPTDPTTIPVVCVPAEF
ncbi:hypothetical protein DFH27DRAFT_542917 [Peziza echinospora]|nr:hypothetical protein DFH27DRAFT_542917 [Peziza echinospora]